MVAAIGALVLALSAPAVTPSVADGTKPPRGVREREVLVGTGEWALPGLLTLPGRGTSLPGVVLVPGSGPADRDETMGPNKPFRDLAWGLAGRGIAVLRFPKRMAAHAGRLAAASVPPSVEQEILDDAAAAVRTLQAAPEVDRRRVFVFGHSQGATLAPRIAVLAGGVAGVAMFAGSTRKPGEMIQEQAEHIAAAVDSDAAAREQAAHMLAAAGQVQRLPDDDTATVLGLPVSYWRFWESYDAARELVRFAGPAWVAVGGRDYMVTPRDLDLWRKALAGRPNVTFELFATLNHAFQEGEGKGTPAEFMRAKPVSPQFIARLAGWIASIPTAHR